MRYLGTFFTVLIVGFWLTMNSMLVWRDLDFRRQGEFKSGVETFLGTATSRESWMSIYQDSRKIGYSGYTMEKLYADDGVEYQLAAELLYRGKFPLPSLLSEFLKNSNQLRVQGRLFLDEKLEPTALRLDIALTFLRDTAIERSVQMTLLGDRVEDHFKIEIHLGDEEDGKPYVALNLPISKMTLSNGLSPTLPISGYEIGRKYRVAVFDPLSSFGFDSDDATVEVIEREEKRFGGMLVDTYIVETRFRGQVSRSWVTASGDVLLQKIDKPFHVVLRSESSRANALRGFLPIDSAKSATGNDTNETHETTKEPRG